MHRHQCSPSSSLFVSCSLVQLIASLKAFPWQHRHTGPGSMTAFVMMTLNSLEATCTSRYKPDPIAGLLFHRGRLPLVSYSLVAKNKKCQPVC
ncbi:hypothetical protein LY76DRAFT_409726 [Colletotrichum caudatum]|nr:hypothetical protein LY76DRAFT_409726 [Colletotrichum caudatum]